MISSFEFDKKYHEFVASSKRASQVHRGTPVIPGQHILIENKIEYLEAPIVFLDESDDTIVAQSYMFASYNDVDWRLFKLVYQVVHNTVPSGQTYVVRGVTR